MKKSKIGKGNHLWATLLPIKTVLGFLRFPVYDPPRGYSVRRSGTSWGKPVRASVICITKTAASPRGVANDVPGGYIMISMLKPSYQGFVDAFENGRFYAAPDFTLKISILAKNGIC